MFDPQTVAPPGAKIKVIGVGGGGGNAVNTMIRCGLEGVDFVTCNTDVQALRFSLASHKLQIGKELTRGLGAGADPDIGRDAALEDRHEIQDILAGADMVFITAGMGGGTGTGGASVVAQIARELGALTVAVVTKPFMFEGKRRRKHADVGMARLRECVDTLITIPNQRLLQVASPELSMIDAFKMADEVLVNAVRGISDIINIPGMVNVDFADVKTVMSCMGQALMGVGSGVGPQRAADAARQAICSPLLEDIDIEGATGILVNITAGPGVTLHEINEACGIIQEAAHEDANFIFGTVIDESLTDSIRVTVIATGFPVEGQLEEGEPKARETIISPYATRLTSPGLITTPKSLVRSGPSPQNYAPLTTRKVETPVKVPEPAARPSAPSVHAQSPFKASEPVAQPKHVEAAPLPREPIFQAPIATQVAHSTPVPSFTQEPSVEMPQAVAHVEMPAAIIMEPSSMSLAPQVPVMDDHDEAMELTRWTLGELDEDDFGSMASLSSPMSELPLDIEEQITQPEAVSDEVLESARIEGARAIVDPKDEFAGALAAQTPETTLAETIFESGLEDLSETDDDFLMTSDNSNAVVRHEEVRAGAVKETSAPLENFFSVPNDAITSDIDRKIDEALELAERMRSPKKTTEVDDLDVPAFLRSGMKDLPLK